MSEVFETYSYRDSLTGEMQNITGTDGISIIKMGDTENCACESILVYIDERINAHQRVYGPISYESSRLIGELTAIRAEVLKGIVLAAVQSERNLQLGKTNGKGLSV